MNEGISREGMEPHWIAKETEKSNLLLKARLLQAQGDTDAAVTLYAQAAPLEEELAAYCLSIGLTEKAFVHRFGAATCWAKTGELHRALQMCEDLAAEKSLSPRMQKAVSEYMDTLRERRRDWLTRWQEVQTNKELALTA